MVEPKKEAGMARGKGEIHQDNVKLLKNILGARGLWDRSLLLYDGF